MAGTIDGTAARKANLRYRPLYPADLLKSEVPQTVSSMQTVEDGRAEIADIIHQRDDRLLVVVGPRSLQNSQSALEYATLLRQASLRFQADLCIVMRCYIDKPHTVHGWSGFLNDPLLDGSFEINKGLRLARQLFVQITEMGVPVATELLGSLSQLYFTDLVSASAIEARVAESPLHRELASSVQFPVGFSTESAGELKVAVEAMTAASTEHHYISVTPEGRGAIAWTPGNDDCFVILQEGLTDAGRFEYVVSSTTAQLRDARKSPVIVVDCSQDDQGLGYQLRAVRRVCTKVAAGERGIVGAVLQSHFRVSNDGKPESFSNGKADGDGMDWEAVASALQALATATRMRRSPQCATP